MKNAGFKCRLEEGWLGTRPGGGGGGIKCGGMGGGIFGGMGGKGGVGGPINGLGNEGKLLGSGCDGKTGGKGRELSSCDSIVGIFSEEPLSLETRRGIPAKSTLFV